MTTRVRDVIFLVGSPFTRRDYDRFGFNLLGSQGFGVAAWEVGRTDGGGEGGDPPPTGSLRVFPSKCALEKSLAVLGPETFVVCYLGYALANLGIYRAISRSGASYGVHLSGAIPPVYAGQSSTAFLFRRLKAFNVAHIINSLFSRVPFHKIGIRPARLVFVTGARPRGNPYPVDRGTEYVTLHGLDYDLYLKTREDSFVVDPKVGVFLDEFRAYHPDYASMGERSPVSPDAYYSALRGFFSSLEARFNVRIVVAAHPRSCYEDFPGIFGAREVIRGRTAQLVARSGFTLMHASTSISFPVLFQKPIVFMTTDEIARSYEGPMVGQMAALLGKKAVNIDQPLALDWEKEMSIDQDAYRRYRDTYLKPSPAVPDLPSWQIVAEKLRVL